MRETDRRREREKRDTQREQETERKWGKNRDVKERYPLHALIIDVYKMSS